MSEPVAPLATQAAPEPIFSAAPLIGIEPSGLCGMVTLRGDLSDAGIAAAIGLCDDAPVPAPLSVVSNAAGERIVWMSPDEVLILLEGDGHDARALVAGIEATLEDVHHMALDVSDARVVIRLTGARVGEVLAKGAPCDCSDHGFPVGTARRTHLGGLAVAFWRLDAETWEIVALRSYAHHLLAWLEQGAQPGSEVWDG